MKQIFIIALLISLFLTFTYGQPYVNLVNQGAFPANIHESSGLAYFNDTGVWTHNDSGGSNEAFRTNTTGQLQNTLTIANATNNDWEDMTQDDAGRIYIADLGSSAQNGNRTIYRFNQNNNTTSVNAETIHIQFSDTEIYDCESMFYFNNSLYFFSKFYLSSVNDPNYGYVRMYKLSNLTPNTAQNRHTAQYVGRKYIGISTTDLNGDEQANGATGAAISPDGTRMAIIGIQVVSIFTNFSGDDFFGGTMTQLAFNLKSQKEAVVFKDNDNLYITDENWNNATTGWLRTLNIAPYLPQNSVSVSRGPYLQTATPTSIVLKWRTNPATDTKVWYGTDPNNLNLSETTAPNVTNHEIKISNLNPNTKYYYAIGNAAGQLQGATSDYYFKTHPTPGSSLNSRIWILGDVGKQAPNTHPQSVRDAFLTHNNGQSPDMILLLGDNAYDSGLDSEYQTALFQNRFENQFRNTVIWPCPGNHEYANSSPVAPYYDIFALPTNGEAGGVASGTEKYYSYDYGNAHFISLDSDNNNTGPTSQMISWLQQDLQANTQDWVIVYWHHAPYTRGSYDSDTQPFMKAMREQVVPILEQYEVDLVLGGHSHVYERSFLIHGHHGNAATFNNSMKIDGGNGRENDDGTYSKNTNNEGTVFATLGCSANAYAGNGLNHPAMFTGFVDHGSAYMDINGDRLNFYFLDENGNIDDSFTLDQNNPNPGNTTTVATTVNAGSDDIEENELTGNMYTNSSDIELVNDGANNGNQTIGIRFNNVNIPAGATITNAYLQFNAKESDSDASSLSIHAQLTPSSPPMDITPYWLSGQTSTIASVAWQAPAWTFGNIYPTPNISTVIQELVDLNGFNENSSITIIITGTGSRTAHSYDGDPTKAATLVIDYETPTNPPDPTIPGPYAWKQLPIGGGGYITGMVIHPQNPNLRFLKTDIGGAYRFDPIGNKYDQILNFPFDDHEIGNGNDAENDGTNNLYGIDGIAVHPTNTNIVYMAADKRLQNKAAAIIKSTDQGTTWQVINAPDGIAFGANQMVRQGNCLAVNPNNPNELWIGARGKGLWKLNGTSFTQVNTGQIPESTLANQGIRGIVFDPNNTNRIYIGYYGKGVYRSTNGGSSFSLIPNSPTNVNDLSLSANGTKLYAACREQGVYRLNTPQSATSWVQIKSGTATAPYFTVTASPSNDNVVLTCISAWNALNGYKFQVSNDSGDNWISKNHSINQLYDWHPVQYPGSAIAQISFDPTPGSNTVYFVDWFSIFKTTNFTANPIVWDNSESKGHEEVVTQSLAAPPSNTNNTLLYSASADVTGFVHNNLVDYPLKNIKQQTLNMPNNLTANEGTSFDFCESDSEFVAFANCSKWEGTNAGLFFSENAGVDFYPAAGYLAGWGRSKIAVSSSTKQNIVAVTNGGIRYSTNKGSSFSSSNLTIPFGFGIWEGNIEPIAADKVLGGQFYVYDYSNGKFYRSTNNGATWTNTSTLSASSQWAGGVAATPGKANHVWAYLNNRGLFQSTNGGNTWTQKTALENARTFAIGKAAPGSNYPTLYTYGRLAGDDNYFVYRSIDEGSTWEKINDESNFLGNQPGKMAADRNVFGRVFISQGGWGVFYGEPTQVCPTEGTSCDDGDPTTFDDKYDNNCQCIGDTENIYDAFIRCNPLNPSINGNVGPIWDQAIDYSLEKFVGTAVPITDLSAEFGVIYNSDYLTLYVNVVDDVAQRDSGNQPYNDDAIEVFLDPDNSRSTTYDANDIQLVFGRGDASFTAYQGGFSATIPGVVHAQQENLGGYSLELQIPWSSIGVQSVSENQKIGIEVQVNDDDDGGQRDHKLAWNDGTDNAWSNPSLFGVGNLAPCHPANLWAYLQGPLFTGTSPTYGRTMRANLNKQFQLLPGMSGSIEDGQPYSIAPWSYFGNEGVGYTDADYLRLERLHGNLPIVDWVLVEFRTGLAANTRVVQQAGLMLSDGQIVFEDPSVFGTLNGAYYLKIDHRNHIGVLSSVPVNISNGTFRHDFRLQNSYANGGVGMTEVAPGKWALFAANGDQLADGQFYDINASDKQLWSLDNGNFNTYRSSDFTMDGDINGLELILFNMNNGVFSTVER